MDSFTVEESSNVSFSDNMKATAPPTHTLTKPSRVKQYIAVVVFFVAMVGFYMAFATTPNHAVAMVLGRSVLAAEAPSADTDTDTIVAVAAPRLEEVLEESIEEKKEEDLAPKTETKGKLKQMRKLHNITDEDVVVNVIHKNENVRTKFGKVTLRPHIHEPINATHHDLIVSEAKERQGLVASGAALKDKLVEIHPELVRRDYEFEEMFIKHPDLFSLSGVKKLTIQERVKSVYVTHAIPDNTLKRGDQTKKDVPPVLLLHGAKFSSATWDKTATVATLVHAGFHVYTVDLPGFGRSEGTVAEVLKEDFLDGLIKKLKLQKPFVVAPSMSGQYAVPYVRDHPTSLSAFIPIAVTSIKLITPSVWATISQKLRILYIYGEKDSEIGVPGATFFAAAPAVEVYMMKQGTHPCYIDKPAQFNRKLLRFLARVTKATIPGLDSGAKDSGDGENKKRRLIPGFSSNPKPNVNTNINTNTNRNANTNTNRNANANTNTNRNANINRNSNTNTNTNSNSNTNTNRNANSNTNANANDKVNTDNNVNRRNTNTKNSDENRRIRTNRRNKNI